MRVLNGDWSFIRGVLLTEIQTFPKEYDGARRGFGWLGCHEVDISVRYRHNQGFEGLVMMIWEGNLVSIS